MTDHEILKIVDETPLEEAPGKLLARASDRGGDDNITVIVVHTRE